MLNGIETAGSVAPKAGNSSLRTTFSVNTSTDDASGIALKARGIYYAPDFVINGGGVINAAAEVDGPYNMDAVLAKVVKAGAEYGLPEKFITSVFNAIHEASVEAQNEIISGKSSEQ